MEGLCVGFGAEDALEAGAGELDADVALAGLLRIGYVDDATVGDEILLHAAGGGAREGGANLEVGADGHVGEGDAGGSGAAKIFARTFFFESDAPRVDA